MIFITDGQHDCNGADKSDLDDPQVLKMIDESGVRIVTIAFR